MHVERACRVDCECGTQGPPAANARLARQAAADAGWEITLTLRPTTEQGWRVGQYSERVRCPACAGYVLASAERVLQEVAR